MKREFEIKAHLSSSIARTALALEDTIGVQGKPIDKKDVYFSVPMSTKSRARVRVINNSEIYITNKRKNVDSDGVERNDEIEFRVVDTTPEDLDMFFRSMGYVPFYEKHKSGYEYYWNDLHIEVLEVDKCGDFIEIEAFPENEEQEKEYLNRMYDVLSFVLVSRDKIVKESYKDMILGPDYDGTPLFKV